jgi:hypothetical protein
MKRGSRKYHGIFCIEGEWYDDLHKPTSIESVLILLKTPRVSDIPYIHRNVATSVEVEHYISKWAQKRYDTFPLLYLGLHGSPGVIHVSNGRGKASDLSLDRFCSIIAQAQLAKRKRILFFGSCGTLALALHGDKMQTFLRQTGLFAVFGYSKEYVGWMDAAFFEAALMYNVLRLKYLTKKSIGQAVTRTKHNTGELSDKLGFRYFVRGNTPG